MNSVLVAGIGNIFHGDDGFGVAVAGLMAEAPLPTGVDVVDFGIRGLDLAFALTGGYRLAILIDTVQRGEAPGTLYLIEPEPADPVEEAISPHQIEPTDVLRLTRILGGPCAQVLLIGCEPASFGPPDEGRIGLSGEVALAVPGAAEMALAAIADWMRQNPPEAGGLQPSLPSSHTTHETLQEETS
jgi:hydrogenase maturation protease